MFSINFRGLTFLRQIKGAEAHFNLIIYWENLEVIRNFAGDDFEKAKYYPEDEDFLLEFEEKVEHHEVFAWVEPGGSDLTKKETRICFNSDAG